MIRQCAILFGCLALGELIVFLTGIKLPSSIIGMLLLTLFLKLGWIKLQWVQGLSDFLVANLGFFFVPPGVALMLYFDVIEAKYLATSFAMEKVVSVPRVISNCLPISTISISLSCTLVPAPIFAVDPNKKLTVSPSGR